MDEKGNWNHYIHYSQNEQKGKKTYLRSVNHILNCGFCKGPFFAEWLKNTSKEEVERRLNEAGEKGDNVHRMIETLIKLKKIDRSTTIYNDDQMKEVVLTNVEWRCMLAFSYFVNVHKAEILENEIPLYNLNKRYAGTTDLVMRLTRACDNRYCGCNPYIGLVGLYDTKSGGEWEDHGPQLGAYAGCPSLKSYLKGNKLMYTANLYLNGLNKTPAQNVTTQGSKFVAYDVKETAIHQKEFLAAITIHDASYKEFDEAKVRDIPDELTII